MNGFSKFVWSVAALAMLVAAQSASAAEIAWQGGFFQAMQSARTKQQPVLVLATMQGCGYCQQMVRESYADKDVARQLNHDFIAVHLDADQSKELLGRMGVEVYPTTIIYSPQGKLLGRLEGYEPTAKLRLAMKTALEHRVAAKR